MSSASHRTAWDAESFSWIGAKEEQEGSGQTLIGMRLHVCARAGTPRGEAQDAGVKPDVKADVKAGVKPDVKAGVKAGVKACTLVLLRASIRTEASPRCGLP